MTPNTCANIGPPPAVPLRLKAERRAHHTFHKVARDLLPDVWRWHLAKAYEDMGVNDLPDLRIEQSPKNSAAWRARIRSQSET